MKGLLGRKIVLHLMSVYIEGSAVCARPCIFSGLWMSGGTGFSATVCLSRL